MCSQRLWKLVITLAFLLVLVSTPLAVESKRNHSRHRRSVTSSTLSAARQQIAADFLKWVASVGARAKLKGQSNANASSSNSKLIGNSGPLEPIVDRKAVASPTNYIVVDQNGWGNFRTVNEAIQSIPKDKWRSYRITIQINNGIYREKVMIGKNRPLITLQGYDQPTIVWNDSAMLVGNKTFDSATVGVSGSYFIARNITFQNDAPSPPVGAVGMQAVALRVSADMAAFYNCTMIGNQDTLYDHNGRHYFKNCFIQGDIDFIFGDGLSMYKSCDLNVVPAASGAVTAQKRQNATDPSGFSFLDCLISGSGQVYLGRAWGPFSRVVYAYTWMENIIYGPGWMDWNIPARDDTVYYGQYKCGGPGAVELGRVAWSHELSDAEAAPFLDISFVDGAEWIPEV